MLSFKLILLISFKIGKVNYIHLYIKDDLIIITQKIYTLIVLQFLILHPVLNIRDN